MDYLLHGLPWATVLKMLIDAPSPGDEGGAGSQGSEFELTDDNAQEVMRMIDSINR